MSVTGGEGCTTIHLIETGVGGIVEAAYVQRYSGDTESVAHQE